MQMFQRVPLAFAPDVSGQDDRHVPEPHREHHRVVVPHALAFPFGWRRVQHVDVDRTEAEAVAGLHCPPFCSDVIGGVQPASGEARTEERARLPRSRAGESSGGRSWRRRYDPRRRASARTCRASARRRRAARARRRAHQCRTPGRPWDPGVERLEVRPHRRGRRDDQGARATSHRPAPHPERRYAANRGVEAPRRRAWRRVAQRRSRGREPRSRPRRRATRA